VIALILKHHSEPPPPLQNLRPDCPPGIVSAIARMLQKAPEDRFPGLEEVSQLFRNASSGDEEEYRLLLGAFATGADTGEAVRRINTPRTPAFTGGMRTNTPRPASIPSSRVIAAGTAGLKPVPRDPTPTHLPAMGPGIGAHPGRSGMAGAAQADWPRTLLKPLDQARRGTRRFRVPGIFTLLLIGGITWFGFLPRIGSLESTMPLQTALMAARADDAAAAIRRGNAPGAEGSCEGVRSDMPSCRRYTPVPLDEISPVMLQAVVIGMDPRFDGRLGNDWTAMRRAAGYPRDAFEWGNDVDRADLLAVLPGLLNQMETVGRAGSLTQRLVQHVYFPPNGGVLRKMREIRVSRRVANALPRERILELYLNVAEFGPGIYGVEAAAQTYFDVSASDLTPTQAATLAATLATPRTSTPSLDPTQMRRRQALVLRRLNGEQVEVPPDIVFPESR
jgi:monofunctional biosynthetic peptidoglycan transglycosylase